MINIILMIAIAPMILPLLILGGLLSPPRRRRRRRRRYGSRKSGMK